MRTSKVSPVYDDGSRYNSREGRDTSSRTARLQAKSRKRVPRAKGKSNLFVTSSAQSTKSMADKMKSGQGEAGEAVAAAKGVMTEKNVEMPVLWWEEWPFSWTYEEWWTLSETSEWNFSLYWDVMNGLGSVNGIEQYEAQVKAENNDVDVDIWT